MKSPGRRARLVAWAILAVVTAGLPANADEVSVSPPQSASSAPEITGDVASSLEASSVATGSANTQWSVTPQGAFAYSIPLTLPAGRGGLEPKLSLTYSSMAGNGLAGIGWTLEGVPAIQRAQGTRGIQYDGADTYAANFAGWGTAADPRSELVQSGDGAWRTRVDDFADYRSAGTCGDGPCSWSMRDGHGTTYTFGDPTMTAPPPPPNARTGATSPALWEIDNGVSAQRGIFVWSLSKVVDVHGNTMTIQYVDPSKTGQQLVPSRIVYSAHATQQTPTREVRFSYEARPDPTPPPYWFDHRLSGVDVLYAGSLVRRYVLAYTSGIMSGRSRLFSVQMLGSDGVTALPPIQFGYQDGRTLLGAATIVRAQGPRSRTGTAFEHVTDKILVGDINGDGRKDLVSVNGNTDGLEVHYALGSSSGLGAVVDYYDDVQAGTFFKRYAWTAEMGDFDGDGFDDVVFAKVGPQWLEWMLAKGSPTGLGNLIPSADHALWGPSSDAVPCVGSGSSSANWWCGARFNVLDLNGDRRLDLVWSHPEGRGLAYALGQAGGTFGPITVATKAPDDATKDYAGGVTTVPGDFNGDGRTDQLLSDTYQSQVDTPHPPFASFVLGGEAPYIFGATPTPPPPLDFDGTPMYTTPIAIDMNGDRHMDVAYPSTPNGVGVLFSRSGNQIEPNAGPTYGPVTSLSGEGQLADYGVPAYLTGGDFDGDGVGDVLYSTQLWNDPTSPVPPDFDFRAMSQRIFRGGVSGPSSSSTLPFTTTKASVVADINGDGRSELLWLDDTDPGHLRLEVAWMNRDATGFDAATEADATSEADGEWSTFVGSGARLFAADLNGDGIDDIVMAPDPQSTDLDWRLVLSSGETPDLLDLVINETGGRLSVSYTPAVDVLGAIDPFAATCGTRDGTLDTSVCGIPNTAGRSLATRVVSDDGRGLVRGKRYIFYNGRVSVNAATSDTDLGFYAMASEDEQTGLVTGLQFRQDPPLYGQVSQQYEYLGNDIYLQNTTWDGQTTVPGATHPRVLDRTRKWLANDAQGSQHVLQSGSDSYAYDDFGNETSVTTCEGSAPTCVTRRSSFTNDTGAWIIGRVDAWTEVVGDGNADPEQRVDGQTLAYLSNGVDLGSRQRLLCADADTCICPRSGDCAPTVARMVPVESGRQYDAFGAPTHVVDALGHATDTTWDLTAAQTSTTTRYLSTANGHVPFTTSRTYDGLGRLATETDLNQRVTTHGYDPLGREALVLLPTGEVQSTSYQQIGDPQHQHVRLTRVGSNAALWKERWFDGNGIVWRTMHNGDGDAVVVINRNEWFGASLRTVEVTRPFFASDGPGASYAVSTDGLGRTTSIDEYDLGASTRLRTFRYLLSQVTETDALGNVRTHTTDDRGLPATRSDAAGTIEYRFDAPKRLRAVTLADGTSSVSYGYDGWARRTRESDPWIGTRQTAYDDVGNVVALADGDNKTIGRTYDTLDRLATETTTDGTTRLDYDNPADPNGRGRLWRVTEPSGVTQMTYDVSGGIASRLRTIAGRGSGLSTTWTFDALGRMTQKVFPDGFVVRYGWTDGDHVGSVSQADGTSIATLSWYTADDHAQVTATPAATTTVTYWPRGMVDDVRSVDASGRQLLLTHYTWDDEGNPRTVSDLRSETSIGGIDTDESQTFDYDGAGRLMSASGTYGSLGYGYDPLGDMTTIGALSLTITPKTFAGGGVAGSYDDAGNLAEKTDPQHGTQDFVYDGKDRLAHVDAPSPPSDKAVADYAYDWSGARVKATRYLNHGRGLRSMVTYYADGYEERSDTQRPGEIATTKTVDLPGGGVVAQITAGATISGQPTAARVEAAAQQPWSGDTLDGMPPGTWYPITTPPGSTGLLLDATGNVVSRIRYLPYGALDTGHSVGFDATTRKFGGRELDEEDALAYFGARYYDPEIGRFTTADTIVGDSSTPSLRFNRYAYADDSPLKLTDPSGHEPGWEMMYPEPEPLPMQPTTIGPDKPMTYWQRLMTQCITPACRKMDRATHASAEYTTLERSEHVSLGRSILRDLPGFVLNVLVLKDVGALAEGLGATLGTSAFVDDAVIDATRTGMGAADAESFAKDWKITDTGADPDFDRLYSRPQWRGGTRMRLLNEQEGVCPLCRQDIEGGVGDIDHMNTTYADRKKFAIDLYNQTGELMSRKDFIDLYHQDLRLTCPSCNRSHWFELSAAGNAFWHGK